MSGPAAVAALLSRLEALGVVVALNDSGDGLKLTGAGHPLADLLEEVKALKPDLLAHLRGEDRQIYPNSVGLPQRQQSSQSAFQAEDRPTKAEAAAPQLPSSPEDTQNVRILQGWESVAAQTGHCGSCARATPAPDWGPLMVVCSCPDEAFWPDRAPLALHVGHCCTVYRQGGQEVGTGYCIADNQTPHFSGPNQSAPHDEPKANNPNR